MSRKRKSNLRQAVVRARDLLERNTCPYDTLEGVLSRGYILALRRLIALGEEFLAPRSTAPTADRQQSKAFD